MQFMASYEDLIAEINKNNRVCPQPLKWNELYELLLSNKKELNNKPSLPLILAAWWDTASKGKKIPTISMFFGILKRMFLKDKET
jgi:hypothetical protein